MQIGFILFGLMCYVRPLIADIFPVTTVNIIIADRMTVPATLQCSFCIGRQSGMWR